MFDFRFPRFTPAQRLAPPVPFSKTGKTIKTQRGKRSPDHLNFGTLAQDTESLRETVSSRRCPSFRGGDGGSKRTQGMSTAPKKHFDKFVHGSEMTSVLPPAIAQMQKGRRCILAVLHGDDLGRLHRIDKDLACVLFSCKTIPIDPKVELEQSGHPTPNTFGP